MTTLTQSDLDDLRRRALTDCMSISNENTVALLDHIAQLTAERDEARKYGSEARMRENEAEQAHVSLSFEVTKRDSRIAELESALLKSDALQDLAYANGAHYALVASNGGASEEKIMTMISDRRHSSLVELKKLRENPSIAELEATLAAREVTP